jgi:hypothetical protein
MLFSGQRDRFAKRARWRSQLSPGETHHVTHRCMNPTGAGEINKRPERRGCVEFFMRRGEPFSLIAS